MCTRCFWLVQQLNLAELVTGLGDSNSGESIRSDLIRHRSYRANICLFQRIQSKWITRFHRAQLIVRRFVYLLWCPKGRFIILYRTSEMPSSVLNHCISTKRELCATLLLPYFQVHRCYMHQPAHSCEVYKSSQPGEKYRPYVYETSHYHAGTLSIQWEWCMGGKEGDNCTKWHQPTTRYSHPSINLSKFSPISAPRRKRVAGNYIFMSLISDTDFQA